MARLRERRRGSLRLTPRLMRLLMTIGALAILVDGLFITAQFKQVWVAHQRAVQAETGVADLNALMVGLDDGETGQRGYLLTGDPAYLAPFDAARQRGVTLIANVTSNPTFDRAQHDQLVALQGTIDLKYNELVQTITAERQGRHADALATVTTGEGKALMDQARTLIMTLSTTEHARAQDEEANAVRARVTGVSTVLVSMLLFGGFFFIVTNGFITDAARRGALADERLVLLTRERQALAQRDQFLAVAAHELRTPLTALLGHLQLMERRSRGDERATKAVGVLLRQAERLRGLTEALLDASRITEGRLSLTNERLDLVPLVEQLIHDLTEIDRTNPLALTLNARHAVVWGDPMRLTQVLVNLIANARKYSDPGTRVDVALGVEDDRVAVRVIDRGIGIPATDLAKLGTRFFRGANSATRPGLGLGLFIAAEIVGLHQGDLTFTSKVGEGTTAIISLPLLEQEGEEN